MNKNVRKTQLQVLLLSLMIWVAEENKVEEKKKPRNLDHKLINREYQDKERDIMITLPRV